MHQRHRMLAAALIAAILVGPFALAQTVVEFWHSQDATEEVLQGFVDTFNARQDRFEVVQRFTGPYQDSAIRLITATRSGQLPALFDAELTVFQRLHDEGVLQDLTAHTSDLPPELLADLQPAMWTAGKIDGAQFGLPFHQSVPVLVYNASVLQQFGVEPPTTWAEFEDAVERVTTRNAKGFVDVAVAFLYETYVLSRGGSFLTPEGEPNFVTPASIETLAMMQRLVDEGVAIPRSFGNVDQALVDFVRGRVMMAFASEAFIPTGERFTPTFDLGTAPIPRDPGGVIPFTGGQLVIPTGVSDEERAGALAFWEFLMEPANVATWVRASYFLPVRMSVQEDLASWYAENPVRQAGIAQLEVAVQRPHVPAYAVWQSYLEEGIERVTIGGAEPEAALQEVQRRALSSR